MKKYIVNEGNNIEYIPHLECEFNVMGCKVRKSNQHSKKINYVIIYDDYEANGVYCWKPKQCDYVFDSFNTIFFPFNKLEFVMKIEELPFEHKFLIDALKRKIKDEFDVYNVKNSIELSSIFNAISVMR